MAQGSYKPIVMFFGMCNSLPTFQQVIMDDMLNGMRGLSRNKHAVHVWKLLERLRKQDLFLKLSKCHFFQKEVEFLWMHVSGEEVRMDYSKVKEILEWHALTHMKSVCSFLG